MADDGATDDVQQLMDSVSKRHDHMRKPDVTRIVRITIKGPMGVKMASEDCDEASVSEAEKSVSLYGLYKVAAIKARMAHDKIFKLDDPEALRIVYQSIS